MRPEDTQETTPSARSGTQSIERSVLILRALASHGTTGWTLPDLSRHCGLHRGTARRILMCLVAERLALYRAADHRYFAGPLLFELSLSTPQYRDFERQAVAALEDLPLGRDVARFLCFRSGDEFVCAARLAGSGQGYSLHPGARRPLASSVAGMAMLLHLPAPQARALFEASLAKTTRDGPDASHSPEALRAVMDASLAAGFGCNEGLLSFGWHSYAVAVRDAQGVPFASLMASGFELAPERAQAACAALRAAAQALETATPPTLRAGYQPSAM